jgi:hypothetical protein
MAMFPRAKGRRTLSSQDAIRIPTWLPRPILSLPGHHRTRSRFGSISSPRPRTAARRTTAATCTNDVLTFKDTLGVFSPDSTLSALNAQHLEVGNLDANVYPDLVVGNASATAPISVCMGQSGGFGACAPIANPGVSGETKVFLADLNRDQRLDLIASGSTALDVSAFLGNGDGTFGARTQCLSTGGRPCW